MSSYEVSQPILNSPYAEPKHYWYIQEGEAPTQREGRRRAVVWPPRDQKTPWDLSDGTLTPSPEYPSAFELELVNLIRKRVKAWKAAGYPGVTRTTLELLQWWQRDGREKRLFYAQIEAAETIIFLIEARQDFLQGIAIPRDEPGDFVAPTFRSAGLNLKENADLPISSGQVPVGSTKAATRDAKNGFLRYAAKMATGSGKTTVMGMLAAWSILNKVNDRGDARFSDVVLVVCPNVTIRRRLRELDPEEDEASLYRTRDLVPHHLMPLLTQGKVVVTNWHVFEPQTVQVGGVSAKVNKSGVAVRTTQTIRIGVKTTTARGSRYLTQEEFERQVAAGLITVKPGTEKRDTSGNLMSVLVDSIRHVKSDTALVNDVLGREVGGKQNILVMNDEAHHAYRIKREEKDSEEGDAFGEEDVAEDFYKEATVWVEGLDRIHKLRGINFCVDLSATPYFLGRVGRETNKPFPWVVSDFGLIDAIESGLVKIPQLAVRDTTGEEIPGYRNIWKWVMDKLTPKERGGKRGSPQVEAILKYAHHPIAMLGGLWEDQHKKQSEEGVDPRPPVFILVCKTTHIARVIYEWIADGKGPASLPPVNVEGFRNRNGRINTIRVDSKVVHETDTGEAKDDESRWMRLTLDTVGKMDWPADRQGRAIYPEGFPELAKKLERPMHPPGRDVRCIVSVGMLTEGWDCSTVTHIIGLRPFMSQLLCEQVVGRGLRRASYELGPDEKFTEEVAQVFGVPFEVIPFKANPQGAAPPPPKRHHIHAIPGKAGFEIKYPRVEGYTQAIRNRVTAEPWGSVPPLVLLPDKIPPEVEMKGLTVNDQGRLSLSGPGALRGVSLAEFRAKHREQELIFDLARALTRDYAAQGHCTVPAQALFPQLAAIVRRYVREKVHVHPPAEVIDLLLAPYYGWVIERLLEAIRPDTSQGEAPEVPRYESNRGPGSTADVDFWTSRDVREVNRSHLNYCVADTAKWEQSAAYYIDTHGSTDAFVKNSGLGFAIPYLHNGQMHDYVPDFIVRLKGGAPKYLILETKGYDPLEDVKRAAAERWAAAVNADGSYGRWQYAVAKKVSEIKGILGEAAEGRDA